MCFSIFGGSIIWNYANATGMTDAGIDDENDYETAEFFELKNNNGEHLWEKKDEVIHHEEKGHMERVLCDVYTFHCRDCERTFDGLDAYMNHECDVNGGGGFYWTTETVYKDMWIVDTAAWDEVVSEYYQCTICGAKKDSLDSFETTAVKAIIPKSINIKGKTGTYKVMAYCKTEDVANINADIHISPTDTFVLTDGAKNVTATVSQPKTLFSASDVRNGSDSMIGIMMCDGSMDEREIKEVSTDGTITADDLSYGTWTGNITFNISVN